MIDDLRPTVLVFTRGATAERQCKRLLPSRLAAMEQRLHESCLRATVTTAREAEARVVVACPPGAEPVIDDCEIVSQLAGPSSFGTRLQEVVHRREGERRSSPLVVVGSDCPDLSATHLRNATSILSSEPDTVVLGPARDGGVYLIASARPIASLLRHVRWRSRTTLASLARSIAAAGRRVVFLERLDDLDRATDLDRWLARLGPRSMELTDIAAALRLYRTRSMPRPEGHEETLPADRSPARAPPRAA